ncbi:type II secretion system F family protein [Streptomyces avidinii]|uniref:Flp pilus assembly protein TadB n=1 Tax=Streptomyces avidinii TaxID=1895 RepID=A0ABS4LCE5_STRAV|nr:type II secretion system F family protein [Streptomyces avidinii]MBP2039721.1 Flp pilus assembly protein TadB [Streptomyces avidinii]GGZ17225.1 membrane protein [Streptomyces avidinii]
MAGCLVHRLGIAVCLAVAALWTVRAVTARIRSRAARRRAVALLGVEPGLRGPVFGSAVRGAVAVWAGPAGALLAGWVLVGGVAGVAVGGLAALGVRRWRSRVGPQGGVDLKEAERQLPFAADLLAACLAAGAGPVEAAEVVGESLGGPVGERLARAGAELRLGGEPGSGWGRLAEIPGARALAECLERAARTGAPAAEPVSRLASGLREDHARSAGARAQRAAVLVTAPVGLCFLPAFLAIGVAPVVIGMASGLLSNT